jgi:Family of unknown function (DUF6338)
VKLEAAPDLFFVVSVFVPGFIYYAVLATFVPQRDSSGKETTLLRLLTGTALNYGVCSPAIYLLLTGELFQNSPIGRGITWLLIIFAVPILLALTAARMSQARLVKRPSEALGLRSISPIPTGWDWIFGLQTPLFLLVTMKDGAKLAGYFGPESMASSDPTRKDLYIEKAFVISSTGEWQEAPNSRGYYLGGDQIALIEFKELGGDA